jgi:hypothetical protein
MRVAVDQPGVIQAGHVELDFGVRAGRQIGVATEPGDRAIADAIAASLTMP